MAAAAAASGRSSFLLHASVMTCLSFETESGSGRASGPGVGAPPQGRGRVPGSSSDELNIWCRCSPASGTRAASSSLCWPRSTRAPVWPIGRTAPAGCGTALASRTGAPALSTALTTPSRRTDWLGFPGDTRPPTDRTRPTPAAAGRKTRSSGICRGRREPSLGRYRPVRSATYGSIGLRCAPAVPRRSWRSCRGGAASFGVNVIVGGLAWLPFWCATTT